MFKILSIFFLISLLTKTLDGQATGSANAPIPTGGVAPPMPMKGGVTSPMPMPIGGVTPPMPMPMGGVTPPMPMPIGGATPPMPMPMGGVTPPRRVPSVDRKNSTEPPLVPMPRDENGDNRQNSQHGNNQAKFGGGHHDNQDKFDGGHHKGSSRSCHQDNEIFDRCGGCERTCTNPNPACTASCNFNNAGCRCRDGFVRDRNGRCISPRNCPNNNPPSCGRNEIFNECGGCEATCNNPNPPCPFICGPGACRCRNGMVRHPNGNCVDRQQCFSNQCRSNEVFNRCSTGCEGTCSNTRPFCMFDSQSCHFSRCECPISSGFVRDNFGNCIPSSQCPSQDSPNCSSTLCPRGNVCVMRKPSNCRFCSEQPTCIQMPSCQNMHCSNGFRCTMPSCQKFPCTPICVRSD